MVEWVGVAEGVLLTQTTWTIKIQVKVRKYLGRLRWASLGVAESVSENAITMHFVAKVRGRLGKLKKSPW